MSGFDCRIPFDQLRDGDRIDLVAGDAERAAIAERLGLAAIARLEAHAVLSRDGDAVGAKGRLKAALEQACVATGEPVPALVDEAFDLRFVPEPKGLQPDEEIELGQDELETIFHDGSAIDLGNAIADTLALSLDPYPRSAGADAALKEAGVMSEEEASPFAALAALKGKLGSQS